MTDWGRVIVTLRAENARLRAALSMVEHVTVNLYPTSRSAVCLWCGQKVEDGHRDDCLRQIALEVDNAPSDPA